MIVTYYVNSTLLCDYFYSLLSCLIFEFPASDGIDFLGVQPGLRRSCFIAMDAVKWMIENISGVHTRSEAIKILQVYIQAVRCTCMDV